MDILIHIANVLLLVSFSVRSMVALRLLNIAAGGFFIAYFLMMDTPLYSSVAWNVLFGVVNLYRIARIIADRRPPHLSAEEQRLFHLAFSELAPRRYRALLDLGQWQDGVPPELVAAAGDPGDSLWVVTSGRLDVELPSGIRALRPGDFVGDGELFTQDPHAVDVRVSEEGVRMLRWDMATLRRFMSEDGESGAVLQRCLGRSLVRRLRAS